eukprot:jgi/Tetstr1/462238/TSEL_000636.t2
MTAAPSEADVRQAVDQNAARLLADKETITMKGARRLLEDCMRLEPNSLDIHKALVKMLVMELVRGEGSPQQNDAVEEGSPVTAEHSKRKKSAPAKSRDRQPKKSKQAAPKAAGTTYGKYVEKLRRICQAATIPVPPILYRGKEEAAVRERLEQLLEKHGLDSTSKAGAIRAAKARLQQQRDMDGIDMSNILEGRPRRGAALAATNNVKRYAATACDSDDEQNSAGGAVPRQQQQRPPQPQQEPRSSSGEDSARKGATAAEDSDGASEEESASSAGEEEAEEAGVEEVGVEGEKEEGRRGGAAPARRRGAVCLDSTDEDSE